MASLVENGLSHSFHCLKCEKLLTCPVMLVDTIGNLCSPCYEKLQKSQPVVALRNSVIESMLKALDFPCENKATGCNEKLTYDNYMSHVSKCPYQSVACLHKPNCVWIGHYRELMPHLYRAHKQHILTNSKNVFKIPFSQSNEECTNILSTDYANFLFHAKVHDDKLKLLLYTSDITLEKIHSVKIRLTYEGSAGTELNCKTVGVINDFVQQFEDLSTEVQLEDGKHHLPEVSVIIDLEPQTTETEETMLRLLECQVCKLYMRPPIIQCTQGHDICSTCKQQITSCPTCRTNYKGTRNYTLESLVSQIRYPCTYEDYGCRVRSMLSENHESVCNYRPSQCPVALCGFKSSLADVTCHLTESHENVCTFGDTVELTTGSSCNWYFIICNKIFELFYTDDGNKLSWKVQIVTPTDNCRYQFEVSFAPHAENFQKRFSLRSPCGHKDSQQVTNAVTLSKEALKDVLGCTVTSHSVKISMYKE